MAIPDFNFGHGDWEIEFYLRLLSVSYSYGTVVGNSVSSWSSGTRYIMVPASTGRIHVGGFDTVAGAGVFEQPGNPLVTSTKTVPIGTWVHVAVNKVGSLVRIWLDGQLSGSGASGAAWNFGTPGVLVGANGWDGASSSLHAIVLDMRVRNVPERTATFSRPPQPQVPLLFGADSVITPNSPSIDAVCNGGYLRANAGQVSWGAAHLAATVSSQAGVAASAAPESPRMADVRGYVARDTEFGGTGRIWGTNEIQISESQKVPTGGRVVLLRQRDKLLARETWADPITGAWAFEGLDVHQDFIALAEDLAGNYRPVAANRLTPEAP